MKIVSSGKVLNSRAFYEKKKRKRRIKLILLVIGFLLLFTLSAYLSRQERFLIAEVAILEEDVVDKEEIISKVKGILGGDYLWIIPRANIFVYPRRAIKQRLMAEFPRLKSVDLDLNGFQTLNISVEERTPFALYCASVDECYFVDNGGLIFAPAPSFSGGAVYFTHTTSQPVENPLGRRFLTIEEFESLSNFFETIAIFDIHPMGLNIGDDEYSLSLPNGGQIIWRRDAALSLVRSNLEAFLSDDSIRAQSNFLDKIKSLDLRTENKVFYKFKD